MVRWAAALGAVALALAGGASALIAIAARSDFVMRGCPTLPRDAWDDTVNCADGWFAQWVFGAAALLCFLAIVVIGLKTLPGRRARKPL